MQTIQEIRSLSVPRLMGIFSNWYHSLLEKFISSLHEYKWVALDGLVTWTTPLPIPQCLSWALLSWKALQAFVSAKVRSVHAGLLLPIAMHVQSITQTLCDPWTVAHPVPLSMGFPRQEYWSGWPSPAPGDLPDPGIEPTSLMSPSLAGGSFTTEPPGKPSLLQ